MTTGQACGSAGSAGGGGDRPAPAGAQVDHHQHQPVEAEERQHHQDGVIECQQGRRPGKLIVSARPPAAAGRSPSPGRCWRRTWVCCSSSIWLIIWCRRWPCSGPRSSGSFSRRRGSRPRAFPPAGRSSWEPCCCGSRSCRSRQLYPMTCCVISGMGKWRRPGSIPTPWRRRPESSPPSATRSGGASLTGRSPPSTRPSRIAAFSIASRLPFPMPAWKLMVSGPIWRAAGCCCCSPGGSACPRGGPPGTPGIRWWRWRWRAWGTSTPWASPR